MKRKSLKLFVLIGCLCALSINAAACGILDDDTQNHNSQQSSSHYNGNEISSNYSNPLSSYYSEPQSSSNNNEPQPPDYSKYSQTLQNVLTDQYYRDLIITDEVVSKDYGNLHSYDNNKYKAIPYGFLEEEGYNIETIKKNIVDAESNMYTIGNDLFVELRVETRASTNYYTHYVVKYTLTEQEINEIDSLFVPVYNSRFSTRVTNYQAPFFVQEISYQKQATMLSKMHMTKDAVLAVESSFDRKKYNTSMNHVMYLKQEIVDDFLKTTFHTFQTHAFVDGVHTTYGINSKAKLNTITLETPDTCCSNINSQTVFTEDDEYINFYLYNDKKLEYEQSTVDINLYSCENANLVNLDLKQFDSDLRK